MRKELVARTVELYHPITKASETLEISKFSWVWDGSDDHWIGGHLQGEQYLRRALRMGWEIK